MLTLNDQDNDVHFTAKPMKWRTEVLLNLRLCMNFGSRPEGGYLIAMTFMTVFLCSLGISLLLPFPSPTAI